ncbi:hypothetical protein M407DRAFT_32925 [Tulasnella calospora MUT 4182]|uniref:Uncharacterized protein n=1 Tax=Tulasnella calospora MUT 4182 TaxID=1051891 RepID=A0A0C3K7P9_9AGAM|nr:hypothetical protein M407DRAFT_32925 [Tulasnella calospora MUT 4182]
MPEGNKERRRKKKYVQPKGVVDCVNAGKILLEDAYAQGRTLPPHLSSLNADGDGAYNPLAPVPGMERALADLDEDEEDEDEAEDSEDEEHEDFHMAPPQPGEKSRKRQRRGNKAAAAAAALQVSNPTDADAVRKAELEAERLGIEPAEFDKVLEKASATNQKRQGGDGEGGAEVKRERRRSPLEEHPRRTWPRCC